MLDADLDRRLRRKASLSPARIVPQYRGILHAAASRSPAHDRGLATYVP
jgi:hypothetical protein